MMPNKAYGVESIEFTWGLLLVSTLHRYMICHRDIDKVHRDSPHSMRVCHRDIDKVHRDSPHSMRVSPCLTDLRELE